MGLTIRGQKTGITFNNSYSALHHNARYLALLFCGMPKFLDYDNKKSSLLFFTGGCSIGKNFDSDKICNFLFSVQLSGKIFPQIMFHSDCEGSYTLKGKLDLNGKLLTGNSKELLKELSILVNEKSFQTQEYESQMTYTKDFYNLVKTEIKKGNGRIIFI